jgi:large subunit ribosomal protein L21
MQAVIFAGGKQHTIQPGETLQIAKLDQEVGAKVDFDQVLLIDDDNAIKIGTPYIPGAKVSAEIVKHGRADKIHILKFKRRAHFAKHQGHRQDFTLIKIIDIKTA